MEWNMQRNMEWNMEQHIYKLIKLAVQSVHNQTLAQVSKMPQSSQQRNSVCKLWISFFPTTYSA